MSHLKDNKIALKIGLVVIGFAAMALSSDLKPGQGKMLDELGLLMLNVAPVIGAHNGVADITIEVVGDVIKDFVKDTA